MTAKHTPGPWHVIDRADSLIFIASADHQTLGSVHRTTANGLRTTVSGPRGEMEANARLIASAPALLAALKAQEEAEKAQQAVEAHAFATVAELGLEIHEDARAENKRLRALRDELMAKAKALRAAALSAAEEHPIEKGAQ